MAENIIITVSGEGLPDLAKTLNGLAGYLIGRGSLNTLGVDELQLLSSCRDVVLILAREASSVHIQMMNENAQKGLKEEFIKDVLKALTGNTAEEASGAIMKTIEEYDVVRKTPKNPADDLPF